ncbi:hypothetical protein BUALT_Bualt13G0053100 [Buddleja alternifolia]|uniref:U-box domain-containing protein n=1 Tax=Buddleja alternifolia TaxID=168488 RepID=A0AAV6WK58_9LAMI|nr:hypothetical protein BUALT_Bualt13G0053100 [Buddleja alternifolia]
MKDPVTTVTGITYDRESIEQWLITASASSDIATVCPFTKQPLTRNSDLTPNHMLRRLIQAWCIANANNGVDQIPTPKAPLQRSVVLKLIRDVKNNNNHTSRLKALKKLDELATENENNKKSMADAGVGKAMALFILKCFNEGKITTGLEEALRILQLTWHPTDENKKIVEDNLDFVHSILWVLQSDITTTAKTVAIVILKNVAEIATATLVERLNLDFFKQMVKLLHKNYDSPQIIKSVLHIMIQTCPSGRNKIKIVEAGAVFELIEIELSNPGKRITDLVFNLLAHLCSCADGRQELLKHAGGIAVTAKRLLRNSPATDDRALCIMELIARFSATREVVMEMLRVSAVSKLCMVLQADCADYLKKKAREILRLHSNAWSDSPCIQVYLLTRYTR